MSEVLVEESKATPRFVEGGKLAMRALVGMIVGYMAYVPVLSAVLHMTDGNIDGERFFYGLFLPFQAPFLLSTSYRRGCSTDELLLDLTGALFLALGAAVALLLRHRVAEQQSHARLQAH